MRGSGPRSRQRSTAWTEFTWQEGGAFLRQYADARGVHRVYRMTFADGVWTMWRDAPGFNQRFTGSVSADGDTWTGGGRYRKTGVTWNLDFELTYVRES